MVRTRTHAGAIGRRRSGAGLSRRLSTTAIATMLSLAAIASLASAGAQAANTSCGKFETVLVCQYYGNSWPANTTLWFESGGNNLRNFFSNTAADGYGGSVYKCAGYVDSGGGQLPRPCGTGEPMLSIPQWRRPGYAFMFHQANGPRNIHGRTAQPG